MPRTKPLQCQGSRHDPTPREAMTTDDFLTRAALLTRYLVAAYASR